MSQMVSGKRAWTIICSVLSTVTSSISRSTIRFRSRLGVLVSFQIAGIRELIKQSPGSISHVKNGRSSFTNYLPFAHTLISMGRPGAARVDPDSSGTLAARNRIHKIDTILILITVSSILIFLQKNIYLKNSKLSVNT